MVRAALMLLLLSGCGREPGPAAPAPRPAASSAPIGPVVVYDGREGTVMRSLLDVYQMQTRTIVELATANDPDSQARADLVILGSLAELQAAAEADAFRPVYDDTVAARIPDPLRDAESRWTTLSVRPRPVFYDPGQVSAAEAATVTDYSDLGTDTWRSRLCLSSSKVPGNRVLVASLIDRFGVRDAEIRVRNWVANLATLPYETDAQLIAAVADGACAIGIADGGDLQRFAAAHQGQQLQTIEFAAPGSMVIDISGAGVARHAKHPDGAVRLLKWLTESSFNSMFAAQTHEYPANSDAAPDGMRPGAEIGDRIAALAPLSELGFRLEDAALLVERAHYP